MNTKDLFEKVQSFSLKLKELKELVKNGDDKTSAQALKGLIQFLSDDKGELKEIFKNMRICLKNKARIWAEKSGKENYRKIGLAKNLFETISFNSNTLLNYSRSVDDYLEYKKTNSRKFNPKKMEKSFQTIKKNILDSSNTSCFNNFEENIKLFKELVVSNSKKEELEAEIVEHRRNVTYYDHMVEWLNNYEDGWKYHWRYSYNSW